MIPSCQRFTPCHLPREGRWIIQWPHSVTLGKSFTSTGPAPELIDVDNDS